MANTGSIVQQIGESFEQIGKDVVKETVKAPQDIVGKALESLGSGSSGKKSGQKTTQSPQASNAKDTTSASESEQTNDEEVKRAIARAALAELAGGKPKEPSEHEKKLQEEEQKKQEKEQKKKAASMVLQPMSSKQKRGDLYGLKAKKSSTEIGKNVRQD